MASRVSSWALLVVALSVVAGIGAAKSEPKEYVITLDSSNFQETVNKHDFIVVDFYAPWCGHCKHLAPEYEKAASMLSSHDSPVVLAKVDVNEEKNKELASKYEIKGLPTLKIFRNGGKDVQQYKGPREAEGIVSYLKRQSGPASTEIKSAEDASSFIGDSKIVVVGVFPKFSGEEFDSFFALAEKLRSDYSFGHTLDAKHLPRGELSVSGPVVRLFKPFDELFVDTKDFHVDAMEKFVEESSIPIVTIFDKDPNNNPFIMKFFSNDNTKAMLFLNLSSEVSDAYKPTYGDIAKQYKGEGLSFLLGDLEAAQAAIQFYGLKEEQAPLILIQTTNGQKYLKPHVKTDEIAPFVKEFKAGNVQLFMKSEPIPAKNNEPTKVIVADTLQDLVLNSGKNVLLELYAPWCGHCKKLAPILDEVATSYKSDSAVLIAKLDAIANDIPNDTFNIKGYPTVYFRTASGKLMRYEGDRTKEDIVGFIEKNRDKTIEPESGKEEL